jgi:serpin B
VTVDIANAIWGRIDIKYRNEFIVNDAKYYGAELKLIDFNEAAPRLINKWVSAKTHGKISKIVDEIDPNTIVFLINAIYFKGAWKTAFDKKKTKEGEFKLLNGKTVKVPMMRGEGHFNHFKGPKFEAISLPYGKEGKMSMYVFLPDEGSNLDELYETLKNYGWKTLFEQFRSAEGEIALPRFKIEYGRELRDALTALGMGIAFDQMRADFRNLCFAHQRVYLQGVLHKSFIEVNEEGTEAAAVTSVRIGITALPQRFKMVVDRPFFFLIRDNETGLILFMGEATNPVS